MASLADAFSAESVNKLMADPRLVLGLQLMSQGRQGSGSQALGQAGSQAAQLLQQQQHSQQLQQYRQAMAQAQQQQMVMRQQAAEQEQQQRQTYQQQLQDPAFLQSLGPMARQFAALGVDPTQLIRAQNTDNLQAHRQGQLAQQQTQFDHRQSRTGDGGGSSGPRMPTQRQVLDQPLGDGMVQRHVLNMQTGRYEPYGEPFSRYSQGRGKSAKADPLEAAIQEMTGGEPTAARPGLQSLPGTGSLQSYAPQQQPAAPMAAQGGGFHVSAPKAGMRVPGQPKPATPTTKAEYDALPAGAQYIDPVSGKTATKRG